MVRRLLIDRAEVLVTAASDKSKVLVVDDEPHVADSLRYLLSTEGYLVRTARDGRNALLSFSEWQPALIVADLRMTPMGGIELCRRIRTASSVPIIVVSGEDGERSKVEALDAGADDYVVKPFHTSELLARVRAALRRRHGAAADPAGTFDAGDFRIDFDRRRVHIRGGEVRLTPKEFDLFAYLARRPGRVVSRDELLERVWGPAGRDHPEYLRVFMQHLRIKLEENPSRPEYLLTEPWVGYRFDPVRRVRRTAAGVADVKSAGAELTMA